MHTIPNVALPYSIHYDHQGVIWRLSDLFLEHIPFHHERLVFCCIGSDRCTGDSLGPLAGSHLTKSISFPYEVIGTLEKPLHALNLHETVEHLNNQSIKPFVVAIDACLGNDKSIGNIAVHTGPLFPGKAVKKELPPIGDLSIKGIVNVGGFMEMLVLQNTRLLISFTMAEKLSRALLLASQRYSLKQKDDTYYDTNNDNTRQQVSSLDVN
ncbi:MAG: spore protease YyaC [Lysinibacillus sp.]